jgi:hypothetical protein
MIESIEEGSDNMTTVEARKLERKLEEKGNLRINHATAEALFDIRARRLVRMTGKKALKIIRSGKCGNNEHWPELISFASILK